MRFLRLLAALVHRHAPQHLGLLPPAAVASLDEPAPEPYRGAAAPSRPSYFTPEQLRSVGIVHGQSTALASPHEQPVDAATADTLATTGTRTGVYPERDT